MDQRRSAEEFLKFLDYVGEKGLMNPTTAYARKRAASAILTVLDDGEKQDLSQLDREQAFHRFQNKNSQNFKPDSLMTYKQRFISGLEDFLKYVENPSGFRAVSTPRTARRIGSREREDTGNAGGPPHSRGMGASLGAPADLLPYPIPLPSGIVAQLYLPAELTPADAARVSHMVANLLKGLVSEAVNE